MGCTGNERAELRGAACSIFVVVVVLYIVCPGVGLGWWLVEVPPAKV